MPITSSIPDFCSSLNLFLLLPQAPQTSCYLLHRHFSVWLENVICWTTLRFSLVFALWIVIRPASHMNVLCVVSENYQRQRGSGKSLIALRFVFAASPSPAHSFSRLVCSTCMRDYIWYSDYRIFIFSFLVILRLLSSLIELSSRRESAIYCCKLYFTLQ
jgi:hypothetical protein